MRVTAYPEPQRRKVHTGWAISTVCRWQSSRGGTPSPAGEPMTARRPRWCETDEERGPRGFGVGRGPHLPPRPGDAALDRGDAALDRAGAREAPLETSAKGTRPRDGGS